MKRLHSIVALTAIFAFWERAAEAYIDPGSTSVIIQGIVGGVAAALVVLRTYRQRLIGGMAALWRRGRLKRESPGPPPAGGR